MLLTLFKVSAVEIPDVSDMEIYVGDTEIYALICVPGRNA